MVVLQILQVGTAKDLGAAIAVFVIVLVAAIIKSWRTGYLREAINTQGAQSAKLDEIEAKIEQTKASADMNGRKLDDLAEAVVLLHADDDAVDEEALREKVGVETLGIDLINGIHDGHNFNAADDDD